jgi:RimJ/RimL family protein N-acetyltransferase
MPVLIEASISGPSTDATEAWRNRASALVSVSQVRQAARHEPLQITATRNVASARVLEKLGFVREGTLREDCVVNGEVSDSWVYGLIRREWRPSSEPVPAR